MTTPAPLPPEAVARALLPLSEARMLPTAAYMSADVLAWERKHLFVSSWVALGRADPEPGAQAAFAAATGSALAVRDTTGELGVFANVCRHRGHELLAVDERECRPSIRCPYHGWTYALDGSLRSAPGTDSPPEPSAHSLIPIAAATEWHGWVLANPSGDAPAFCADALDRVLAPYEPERLVRAARHDYEVAANWKVIHENYQECVHCPQIHPQLCRVSPPGSGENVEPREGWSGVAVGGWMSLADSADTMSTSGHLVGTPLPGLDDGARRRVAYFALLPNLLISAHPDYVMTHRLEPIAPDRTRVECEWLFAPEAVEREGFDPSDAVGFWDLTNRQDWAACESVQRGLASGVHQPGPLLRDEDAVHHLVGLVARAYLGGGVG